jgi:hypothetical protein
VCGGFVLSKIDKIGAFIRLVHQTCRQFFKVVFTNQKKYGIIQVIGKVILLYKNEHIMIIS